MSDPAPVNGYPNEAALPVPSEALSAEQVCLQLVKVVPSDPPRGFVPYYHFRITVDGDVDAGHINFRVGDSEHIRRYAGHIGFEVLQSCRGHGYARQACLAIAPLVRTFYRTVVITCDPDNIASLRTIERLGARFIDETIVPPHDPQYRRGSRIKRRYYWSP